MTDAEKVLAVLITPGDGLIDLRGLRAGHPPRQLFLDPSAPDTAMPLVAVLRHWRGRHVYFGVASRKDATSGEMHNCARLAAVWIDLDYKRCPETEGRRLLTEFPFPANIRVATGGGLHAYWLLAEPLDVQADAALIRDTLERLAVKFNADPSVTDPSRVLRVPGTLNHKFTPPRPVVLEHFAPERRIPIDDLREYLPPRPASPTAPTSGGRFGLPETLAPGERYIHLFRLARSEKARGLGSTEVRALLEGVNRERCVPPHPPAELDRIVANAFEAPDRPWSPESTPLRTDEEAHGTATELEGSEVLGAPESPRQERAPEQEGPDGDPPYKLLKLATTLSAPAIRYRIEPFAPDRMLTLISGRDKRGKTLLAQEMVRACLTGEPLFGRHATHACRVAAAFLDDPLALTLERLATLGIRHHPHLMLVSPLDFAADRVSQFFTDFEAECRRWQPGLIVLDALYCFIPPTQEAGNDAARMAPLMRRLDALATSLEAALALVAHDNKSGLDVAGSYAIRAMAKTILRLKLPQQDENDAGTDGVPTTPRRVLTIESKLVAAQAFTLELTGVGQWALLGSPAEVRGNDLAAHIRTVVAGQPGVTAEEVYAQVPGRKQDRVAALGGLLTKREIERTGEGVKGRPYRHWTTGQAPADALQVSSIPPIGPVLDTKEGISARKQSGNSGISGGRRKKTPSTGKQTVLRDASAGADPAERIEF